jgi:prepilin-type processing-associated H-X9-DG protein
MTDTCKRILGSATFLEGNQYTNLCDDLEGLEWWDSTLDLNCLYLGLSGLAYSGPDRQETVTVMRNRVLNFFKAIGHTMQSTWKGDNEPRLKMKLYEDVHPSLIQVAKRLEKLVIKFDLCVEIVLVHNGYNVHVMEADIARLATSASYIYGLTATLGRANRSYCDGHAHGDHEVNVAIAYSIVIEPIVMADLEYTARLEKEQIDPTIKYVSEYMSEQGCYAAVHPLTKNMF